jgi:Cdc25 family phosphatase
MARSVTYVSAAKLVSMARGNHRMAVIDVRYERGDFALSAFSPPC